ncbi:MAG: cell division protein FtsZ [Tannerellaceae bacterium]|jgi:cell division protein FtsZ|nr:cell division protein FtsZ [Tannerellaceae bacterium]
METSTLEFDLGRGEQKIIKVIGVGGGGGNAVTHMYRKGIHDVSFLLCNTDEQALRCSEVPNRLVLGLSITEGMGSGNEPDKAREAAKESEDEIADCLKDGTKMVFVTAGMGGGTGTGAAPIVAGIAKRMNILTVGIVTIPFLFEGRDKIFQALRGVEEIRRNVDALLVINNESLREVYSDLTMLNAFAKADDTLTIAAKSIAEIITLPGLINTDFADVNTTMKNGGVALISNGYGEGDRRLQTAINNALHSPLLNNNDIFSARKILFNISFSEESPLFMEEMNEVHNFMAKFNPDVKVIWGTAIDNSLGRMVKITIIATGFGIEAIPEVAGITQTQIKEMEKKMEIYYSPLGKGAAQIHFAILSTEELDDDRFIAMLEDSPTCKRTPGTIANFRAEIKKASSGTKNPPASSGENNTLPVINF